MLDKQTHVIAIFDFDGTLTYRDTLISFLLYVQGWWNTLAKLILQIPTFIAYFFGRISRQAVKESVLTRFFAGTPLKELQEKGKQFALGPLNHLIRPEALARLKWHQSQGHHCILISATLDLYLEPWGKFVGFQDVITSKIASDNAGNVTGLLIGANCWGPEKVKRLNALIPNNNSYTIYAYGDSLGDKELLAQADFPFYRTFKPDCL